MVRLAFRFFTAAGAIALSSVTVAINSAGDPPAGQADSVDTTEALAEVYWSERTGRLPPNRPVTTKPTPKKSRQTPPAEGRSGEESLPVITLPGGRSR